MAYAVMLVVVRITAMQKMGVSTTSLLAVLGAAGLAVGLAMKDSLSNIASGVMLIVLRPFRDGDSVQAVSYTHLDVYKRQDEDVHALSVQALTCLLYTSRCV